MKTLTFGGHELEFEVIGDEVYIKCKNVTGTFSQIMEYRNKNSNKLTHFFGEAKAKEKDKNFLQVGCLTDSQKKIDAIINHCKTLLNK